MRIARRPFLRLVVSSFLLLSALALTHCSAQSLRLQRQKATVVIEPFAPNIVRVTLSLDEASALAGPGYGVSATPDPSGWHSSVNNEGDHLASSRLAVTVLPDSSAKNESEISRYFSGSAPWVGLTISTGDGKTLLKLNSWQMAVPNHKDGNAQVLNDRRATDQPFFQVGATFASPSDEHYYGLGQNQEGSLDHREHALHCAHDYDAPAGQSVCVPFVVTNKGYGLVWDNPSRTTVSFGFNGQTAWTSEVGQRVSFFLIAGSTYDEIYKGFRLLTGDVPMLPKSAYGYIQSKQRYKSQEEMLSVAHGYRERHLPIDMLVVDWFHYTKMGEMDMTPSLWPDPVAMNRELHSMNIDTMISIWPRFTPESRYFETLKKNGWFEALADGTPTDGLPYDRAGSDIDSTNPLAAAWYWDRVRENYAAKGFNYFWADETEPDLPPNGSFWSIGPGTQFFNVYPYFHTLGIYKGMRRDLPGRALILARDTYLGAQHNGAIFWSSDISPNWDTLQRQIPTGINFVASGMPYWSTDIGGWQGLPARHKPSHAPLIDPADARAVVGEDDDYPELYVRWFQYGSFQPIFRSHGSRTENEVWSYGKEAEAILEKYLRLRYRLMPYIYSLAYQIHRDGAPQMRGLFLDFGNDPNVAGIGDEYMFGPALLVAPVVQQGVTRRSVYLPAGADWYNFWTNEYFRGGQTVNAEAGIDTIPLFVRAGSILPLGSAVESTKEKQDIQKILVYPGADAHFTLYADDGSTYDYEKGRSRLTELRWSEATHSFTHTGDSQWNGADSSVLEVIHASETHGSR